MVIPLTDLCSFPCQKVIEGGVHHDLFDNNVKLGGLSGNAVFPCMLCYGSSKKLCNPLFSICHESNLFCA